MTKAGDCLRHARADQLDQARNCDGRAASLEAEASALRKRAVACREFACQLGASVQVLEGDDAPLDFPTINLRTAQSFAANY